MNDVPCQHLQIEALRQQLARWEGVWRQPEGDPAAAERATALSSGCPAIDRALPEKGFRRGTLVEWLGGEGDGTATLAFRAAASALRAAGGDGCGGTVVVLDRSGEFYPPAAVAQGIEPARLMVVHPGNQADHTWALDQALRCPAVAAVIAWPDGAIKGNKGNRPHLPEGAAHKWKLSPLLPRTFRRLQLAVEQGGGLGLLIRPESVRSQPSWADVRLLVESLPSGSPYGWPRRMRVVLLRCRGGRGEQTVEVEINHETYPLPET
jgi:hypothetical protein